VNGFDPTGAFTVNVFDLLEHVVVGRALVLAVAALGLPPADAVYLALVIGLAHETYDGDLTRRPRVRPGTASWTSPPSCPSPRQRLRCRHRVLDIGTVALGQPKLRTLDGVLPTGRAVPRRRILRDARPRTP